MLRHRIRVAASFAPPVLLALLLGGVMLHVDQVRGAGPTASAQELPRHVLAGGVLHAPDTEVALSALVDAAGDAVYGVAAPGSVIEGIPACTDHIPTKWHPLVKKDAVGKVTCTYGHEHHADPNAVNDLFGQPGAWFGGSGQAVSYPWQTSSAAGTENVAKHEGYKWYVARDMACRPFWPAPNDGCLRAWRVQVHTRGDASDAVARFHSYSMELLVEYHGVQGVVRHGGHLDFGHLALKVDGGGADANLCPTLASNPPPSTFQYGGATYTVQSFTCGKGSHREHSSANVPAPHTAHNAGMGGWYANHLVTSLSTTLEEWGPVNYQNPASQLFHPAAQRGNNSKGNLGNMSAGTNYSWLAPYTSGGRVTFAGYTDRHGTQVGGCAAPSVDCVTLKIEGAPAAVYVWNASRQGMPAPPDYDVPSPVTGRSLISFPN